MQDDSGQARVAVTVTMKRGVLVATVRSKLAGVEGQATSYLCWRPRKALHARTLDLCVTGTDAGGNVSQRSCALAILGPSYASE